MAIDTLEVDEKRTEITLRGACGKTSNRLNALTLILLTQKPRCITPPEHGMSMTTLAAAFAR